MATTNTINLAAATRNIVMEQGASIELGFTVTRGGSPLDLTNFTLNMQVRRTFAATEVLLNCTLANGRLQMLSAPNGTFRLVLAPADTTAIRFNTEELSTGSLEGVFDIELTNTLSNSTLKFAKGSFTINREITRV